MMLRRALLVAACVFPVVAGPAAAQLQPWPDQPQQQAPAASPWDQKEPPCVKEFGILRDDAQKKAGAIQAASKRKATPKEACGLFNAFAAAEVKMIKYATSNAAGCGIPPEVVAGLKKGHERTNDIRTKVCQAAAAPQRNTTPSLSDALGSSAIPDANNIKTGRGTFDTLTGTPLGGTK
jgi:hypothetical protein